MKQLSEIIISIFLAIPFLLDKIYAFFIKRKMNRCGRHVYLRPMSSDFKGIENFRIGNHVSIPKGSTFYSTKAMLTVKDNVIFGPNPTIITGDHRIDVIGTPIIDSHESLPQNDMAVTIEEDVWTGANIVILKGVTIGRGSIIAAGAVVNKSCPPYSIIGGIPAKVLKYRFSIEECIEHEKQIYPVNQRYSEQHLEQSRAL